MSFEDDYKRVSLSGVSQYFLNLQPLFRIIVKERYNQFCAIELYVIYLTITCASICAYGICSRSPVCFGTRADTLDARGAVFV